MGMGRHGVPDAPLLQDRHPHHQLTARNAVRMDVLVDRPPVRVLLAPELRGGRLGERCRSGRVFPVRGITHEVEPGRSRRVRAGKEDLTNAAADVEAVVPDHRKLLPVDHHRPRSPDVDHADLPALGKVFGRHFFLRRQQREPLPHRHCRAGDRSVDVGIDHRYGIRDEQRVDQKGPAKVLDGHGLETARVRGKAYVHRRTSYLSMK